MLRQASALLRRRVASQSRWLRASAPCAAEHEEAPAPTRAKPPSKFGPSASWITAGMMLRMRRPHLAAEGAAGRWAEGCLTVREDDSVAEARARDARKPSRIMRAECVCARAGSPPHDSIQCRLAGCHGRELADDFGHLDGTRRVRSVGSHLAGRVRSVGSHLAERVRSVGSHLAERNTPCRSGRTAVTSS